VFSIDKKYDALYEINKSKFFSFAYPVFDVKSVDKLINDFQSKYSDATHVCYAYLLDSPRVEKANDDGEPSGTAGKPLLELLKKKKLSNTLVVVVRYFGGIKLGAGGLVRAYTTAGNMALDKASVVEFITVNKYMATLSIADGVRFKNYILNNGGKVLNERYEDKYIVEYSGEITNLSQIFDVDIQNIGGETVCR